MLDKAHERKVYTGGLWCEDVLQFFTNCVDVQFDLVLSSDVFVYIGDLSQYVFPLLVNDV